MVFLKSRLTSQRFVVKEHRLSETKKRKCATSIVANVSTIWINDFLKIRQTALHASRKRTGGTSKRDGLMNPFPCSKHVCEGAETSISINQNRFEHVCKGAETSISVNQNQFAINDGLM